MKNKVYIGKIISKKGLKGELKIKIDLEDSSILKKGDIIYTENQKYTIQDIKFKPGDLLNLYIKFEGINNIDDANKLINSNVYLDQSKFDDTRDDEVFIYQIIDFDVFADKNHLGKIKNIENHGSTDIFVLKSGNDTIMIPLVEDLIELIDEKNKKIHLNNKIFSQVGVKNEN